jgi:hypothetical protein
VEKIKGPLTFDTLGILESFFSDLRQGLERFALLAVERQGVKDLAG